MLFSVAFHLGLHVLKKYLLWGLIPGSLERVNGSYGTMHYIGLNPLLHNNASRHLKNIMYLKILWKMKHLLHGSKCSIFHIIFKSISNLT